MQRRTNLTPDQQQKHSALTKQLTETEQSIHERHGHVTELEMQLALDFDRKDKKVELGMISDKMNNAVQSILSIEDEISTLTTENEALIKSLKELTSELPTQLNKPKM